MAKNMVQYLHFRILKFPLILIFRISLWYNTLLDYEQNQKLYGSAPNTARNKVEDRGIQWVPQLVIFNISLWLKIHHFIAGTIH